jgi:hypothetical protein
MSINLIKNFDPDKFNTDFDSYQTELKEKQEIVDKEELNKMNEDYREKIISELSFQEYLYDWKYSILNLINNIIHLKINKDTFTQGNILFHLGITILIFTILFYILFSTYNLLKPNNIQKIIYEHHYFKEL